jgi:hypothetical protein
LQVEAVDYPPVLESELGLAGLCMPALSAIKANCLAAAATKFFFIGLPHNILITVRRRTPSEVGIPRQLQIPQKLLIELILLIIQGRPHLTPEHGLVTGQTVNGLDLTTLYLVGEVGCRAHTAGAVPAVQADLAFHGLQAHAAHLDVELVDEAVDEDGQPLDVGLGVDLGLVAVVEGEDGLLGELHKTERVEEGGARLP